MLSRRGSHYDCFYSKNTVIPGKSNFLLEVRSFLGYQTLTYKRL